MRINHNIAALNTYSRLAQATTAQSKSLEKLSSGQRINKAGDDAAGLAISEKMRAQIRGLNQASRNSQDGISMIQTAEGALNETHSILQRMRELAVQSANDTNTTQDRGEIQKEVNQLSSEINRIAGTTEFNKQTLLDGGQAGGSVKGISTGISKAFQACSSASFSYDFHNGMCAGNAINLTDTSAAGSCVTAFAATLECTTTAGQVKEMAAIINSCAEGWTAEAVGGKLTITAVEGCVTQGTAGNCANILTFDDATVCYDMTAVDGKGTCSEKTNITLNSDGVKEGVTISVGDCTVGFWDSTSGTYANEDAAKIALGADKLVDISCSDGSTICVKDLINCASGLVNCTTLGAVGGAATLCVLGDDTLVVVNGCETSVGVASLEVKVKQITGTSADNANGITLQIGANTNQTFNVSFENMTGQGIGVTSQSAGSSATACNGNVAYFTAGTASVDNNGTTNQFALDVSSAEKATNAISVIDDAITKVSGERSKLGAYQNRLEHTISNLDASSENMTAAESRVRDVDMAKEMMEFTKNNILNQAATSMLSQANQQPQGVLKLLG